MGSIIAFFIEIKVHFSSFLDQNLVHFPRFYVHEVYERVPQERGAPHPFLSTRTPHFRLFTPPSGWAQAKPNIAHIFDQDTSGLQLSGMTDYEKINLI